MKTFEYTIQDALGIHARPAGMLVKEAGKYGCAIQLQNGEKTADSKRIFTVLGLSVRCGDTVRVTCTGDQEEEAAEQLALFFKQNL